MDKNKLQALIESKVEKIISEQKRVLVLERKMVNILSEAKQLRERKTKLKNRINENKNHLKHINETIAIQEQFFQKLSRGFKSLFGGGLTSKDLEDISSEREEETKRSAAKAQELAKRAKDREIEKIALDTGAKIDNLKSLLFKKFDSKTARTPEVNDLDQLNMVTMDIYKQLKNLEKNKYASDPEIKKVHEKAVETVKRTISQLSQVRDTVKRNLERQIEMVQGLIADTEKKLADRFAEYSSELASLSPETDYEFSKSWRELSKAARPSRVGDTNVEEPKAEPAVSGIDAISSTLPSLSSEPALEPAGATASATQVNLPVSAKRPSGRASARAKPAPVSSSPNPKPPEPEKADKEERAETPAAEKSPERKKVSARRVKPPKA